MSNGTASKTAGGSSSGHGGYDDNKVPCAPLMVRHYAKRWLFLRWISPYPLWIVPLCLCLVPPGAFGCYLLLDLASHGYPLVCVSLSLLATLGMQSLIRWSAPTVEDAEATIGRETTRTSFWCLVGTILLARKWQSKAVSPKYSPAMFWQHYLVVLQLALGVVILSLAVLSRYVGPCSVVRCSTTPLPPNPTGVLWTNKKSWSIEGLLNRVLDELTTPADNATKKPATLYPYYRRPTLVHILAQLALHAVAGFLFAFAVHWQSAEWGSVLLHSVCCAWSGLVAVFVSVFVSPSSHELDPTTSLELADGTYVSWRRGVLASAIVAPLLVHLAQLAATPGNQISILLAVVSCFKSLLSCLCAYVYLTFLGFGASRSLVALTRSMKQDELDNLYHKGHVPRKAIYGSVHDKVTLIPEELAIQSILSSIPTVSRQVLLDAMTAPNVVVPENLAAEEMKRNVELAAKMTSLLFSPLKVKGEASSILGEDLFRTSLLESLGGGGGGMAMSPRYKEAIHHRLRVGQGRPELVQQPFVPLVRSLCAYLTFWGEALHQSCVNKVEWYLSTACLVCVQYGVWGATRLIVTNTKQDHFGWLSFMRPALLRALFRLQSGTIQFAASFPRGSGSGADDDEMTRVQKQRPDLLPVLVACRDAASFVVRVGGDNLPGVQLASEERTWLHSLTHARGP